MASESDAGSVRPRKPKRIVRPEAVSTSWIRYGGISRPDSGARMALAETKGNLVFPSSLKRSVSGMTSSSPILIAE